MFLVDNEAREGCDIACIVKLCTRMYHQPLTVVNATVQHNYA